MSEAIQFARGWERWSNATLNSELWWGWRAKRRGKEIARKKKAEQELKRKMKERIKKRKKEGMQARREGEKKEKRRPGHWIIKWTFQSGSCACDPWTWRPLPHAEMLQGALVSANISICMLSTWAWGHAISSHIPQCLPCCWVSNDLKN